MMKQIVDWLGDVYAKQGYVAVLVALVVLVGLLLLVSLVSGIDLGQIVTWVGA